MINFRTLTLVFIIAVAFKANSQQRPQTPQPPFPYTVEEVSYTIESDTTVRLAATLTIPKSKGPFKAILIIGGSGQTSRDQPFFGHKPLWVLSDYLTRLGYATLRFDDRGAGQSTKGSKKLHELEEKDYLADAAAGIDFLKQHPLIDPSKIGVIGHSAGATQGLAILADEKRGLCFSIMLAGCVSDYPHMIVAQQSKLMAKAAGWSIAWQKADSSFVSRSIHYTKSENNYEQRYKSIKAIADDELSKLEEQQRDELQKKMYTRVHILSSEQFYQAAQQEKDDYLLKIKSPVLIINGDLDLNVDAAYHSPKMAASLKKNFHQKSRIVVLKGINHMLQGGGKTGLMEESKEINETISPLILKEIKDWLTKLNN